MAAAQTIDAPAPAPRRGIRAELVLLALAALSLALLPVHVNSIYDGLPAHPLFLHVPVILIPVVAIAALVMVARPRWLERYELAIAAVAVIALAGTILTVGAGSALRNRLGLGRGGPRGLVGGGGFGGTFRGPSSRMFTLVSQHASAGHTLELLMIAFTPALIVMVLSRRIARGRQLGVGAADRLLGARATGLGLGALVTVLAVLCGYYVFHTGDLGAKAVWSARTSGPPGGGFPGGFGGGGPGGAGGGAGGGPGGARGRAGPSIQQQLFGSGSGGG